MNAAELRAARTTLGLTEDQLAAELGITPHSYHACEAGEATLPKRQARALAFRVAVAEREAALAASDLSECDWMARWQAQPPPQKLDALTKHIDAANAHRSTCPTCQARDRFINERFPPMPKPPLPLWIEAVGRINDWLQKRPPWLRPAAIGAMALGALTLVRAIFIIPSATRHPALIAQAMGAVLLAAIAGAAGGLVYYFAGRPLRRVRGAGPYLAGIVTVAGYLLAIGAMMAIAGERVPLDVVAFVIVTTLFGLVVGHTWMRGQGERG